MARNTHFEFRTLFVREQPTWETSMASPSLARAVCCPLLCNSCCCCWPPCAASMWMERRLLLADGIRDLTTNRHKLLPANWLIKGLCGRTPYPPFFIDCIQVRLYRARICRPFKEPRNRFPAWRACTTTLLVVPARQAT
jgi:hypothetical protein